MGEWEGKEDELLKAVVDKYKARLEQEEADRVYGNLHGAEVTFGQ